MVVYIKKKEKMLPKYVKLYLYLALILIFLIFHVNVLNSQWPYKDSQRVSFKR